MLLRYSTIVQKNSLSKLYLKIKYLCAVIDIFGDYEWWSLNLSELSISNMELTHLGSVSSKSILI